MMRAIKSILNSFSSSVSRDAMLPILSRSGETFRNCMEEPPFASLLLEELDATTREEGLEAVDFSPSRGE
jgi:hypothetical protein